MQQTAKIIEVLENHSARISVKRKSACSADCENCHGCAHPEETITVTAYNAAEAQVGETVLVESSSKQVIGLAALLYIMPVVLMIAAYFLPFKSENAKILASVCGLVAGLAICVWQSARMKRQGRMTFVITRVLSPRDDLQ